MNKLFLSIVYILFSAIGGYAQINSRPGYIITNLNDTVYGTIDYRFIFDATFKYSPKSEYSTIGVGIGYKF